MSSSAQPLMKQVDARVYSGAYTHVFGNQLRFHTMHLAVPENPYQEPHGWLRLTTGWRHMDEHWVVDDSQFHGKSSFKGFTTNSCPPSSIQTFVTPERFNTKFHYQGHAALDLRLVQFELDKDYQESLGIFRFMGHLIDQWELPDTVWCLLDLDPNRFEDCTIEVMDDSVAASSDPPVTVPDLLDSINHFRMDASFPQYAWLEQSKQS